MRYISLFFAFMIIVICTHAQDHTQVKATLVDDSFDTRTKAKLDAAVHLLDSVINSEHFRKGVLKIRFKVGNNELSSQQILDVILSGMNHYTNAARDFSIDLKLRVFDRSEGNDNFGTTNMDSSVTRTHRCYILQNDVKCYTAHLAHEYMHEIGFLDTRSFPTFTKTYSVPYKIGDLINALLHNRTFCKAIDGTCTKVAGP